VSTVIVGCARSPYSRHPPDDMTAIELIAMAARAAVADAGLEWEDIDGLAVASLSLLPDHAIDVAWHLGLSLTWIEDCSVGGASGVHMLQSAASAIEAGHARTVLVVAGDRFDPGSFAATASSFNSATRDLLAPLDFGGTNALFAMLTSRQMAEYDLDRSDYGHLVIGQRQWASLNPNAVYRTPMSMDDYLTGRSVASPLSIFDCPPVVAGAEAVVVVAESDSTTGAVRVSGTASSFNPDHQRGTGLRTGVGEVAERVAEVTGIGPSDCDVYGIYDDYPVVVLAQLLELGLVPGDDLAAFCRSTLAAHDFPMNTSGGQLSAGQAGFAGSLLAVTEIVSQLRGRAGDRQVDGARVGLATGYGMVLYRYGAASAAAVLEAI
jgi:acetyl-CoA acetyltransferase